MRRCRAICRCEMTIYARGPYEVLRRHHPAMRVLPDLETSAERAALPPAGGRRTTRSTARADGSRRTPQPRRRHTDGRAQAQQQGVPVPDVTGGSTLPRESSASPRAIREGNKEPFHSDGVGSIGQAEPSKKDPVNEHAWSMLGERYVPKHGA